MNKEEVLEKSRAAKEDEGIDFVENKGRKYGELGFSTVFIMIMLFNLFTNQKNFVPFSMFFAYMAAQAYGKYKINKGTSYMITIISAAIASICFFACHVVNVLGIQ